MCACGEIFRQKAIFGCNIDQISTHDKPRKFGRRHYVHKPKAYALCYFLLFHEIANIVAGTTSSRNLKRGNRIFGHNCRRVTQKEHWKRDLEMFFLCLHFWPTSDFRKKRKLNDRNWMDHERWSWWRGSIFNKSEWIMTWPGYVYLHMTITWLINGHLHEKIPSTFLIS